MAVKLQSSPFGGRTRTQVLLALCLLTESYARELSRVLGTPLSAVQKALRSLELDGLVAGRSAGRTRPFRINPRYFAHDTLQAFLRRLSEPEANLRKSVEALRRRPRRTGKPL